jgi:hypothetical protein
MCSVKQFVTVFNVTFHSVMYIFLFFIVHVCHDWLHKELEKAISLFVYDHVHMTATAAITKQQQQKVKAESAVQLLEHVLLMHASKGLLLARSEAVVKLHCCDTSVFTMTN